MLNKFLSIRLAIHLQLSQPFSLKQTDIASVLLISFFSSHIVYYNSQYYAVVLLSDLK